MTFRRYSLKTQLLLALIFAPLNFFVALLCNDVLHLSLFMDMIFIYAAGFFGVPCGIIVCLLHSMMNAFLVEHMALQMLYSVCSMTGVLLTWLLVTRHDTVNWVRVALLIFVSTVIISLEGSIIYALFFVGTDGENELDTVLFLMYSLVMQNWKIQPSAFLARLPVNLCDKAIAVFAGYGIYRLCDRILQSRKPDQSRM